jgi:hypothetical protein
VLQFLSYLCPSSLSTLAPYTSTLSVLLNEQGGIIDDMMITKHDDDEFYVVTNAGRAKEDAAWLESRLAEWNSTEGKGKGNEVKWERFNGWGLIALQGEHRAGSSPRSPHAHDPRQAPKLSRCCKSTPRKTSRKCSLARPLTSTWTA